MKKFKLNNKGYLLVEIIVASVLAMTVGWFLTDLTIKLKNKNDDEYVETVLIINKSLMTQEVMNDLNNYAISGIELSNKKASLHLTDSEGNTITKIISITQERDPSTDKVTKTTFNYYTEGKTEEYYTKDFSNNLIVGGLEVSCLNGDCTTDEGVLTINIPAYTLYSDTDYGLNLIIPYSSKIAVSKKLDNSNANSPEMPNTNNNLIPVYYDFDNDAWKKADVNNSDVNYQWYDYDSEMWANAVTVTDGTRSTYNNAALGTAIPLSDILGMWVWIPRYEYKISTPGTTTASEIYVNFISNTDINTTSGYLIAPAFRNGSTSYTLPNGKTASNYSQGGWDSEIKGFWYGKFETGTSGVSPGTAKSAFTNNIYVKPDMFPLGDQNVSNQYLTAQNAKAFHGISTGDVHMSKNDEWGAVAYLSASKYGKFGNSAFSGNDKEVYMNNSWNGSSAGGYQAYTGRSAGIYSGSSLTTYNNYGKYEYNDCPANSSVHNTSCTKTNRVNNKNKGTGASTTGNIYGVYDMAGGSNDRVMAVYNSTLGTSGFSSLPAHKYYNNYTTTNVTTACNGTECYGMAWSTETGGKASGGQYSWYKDYFLVPDATLSWSERGGSSAGYNDGRTGVFTASAGTTSGAYRYDATFRIVITFSN